MRYSPSARLEAAGVEHVKIETEYAGHGRVLCNTLPLSSQRFDAVVAIGGFVMSQKGKSPSGGADCSIYASGGEQVASDATSAL